MKFGCNPRTYVDPAIQGWTSLKAVHGAAWSWKDPGDLDLMKDLPADIGMMLNNGVGDCAEAACYHLLQAITKVARGVEITEPDSKVGQLYTEVTGWKPDDPSTDLGTDPNQLFRWATTTGIPILPSPAPRDRHKFLRVYEVDQTNVAHMREAADLCGGLLQTFIVPKFININQEIWDINPAGDQRPDGGHMVYSPGFGTNLNFRMATWALHRQWLTPAFLAKFGMGCFAVIDPSWLTSGKTPAGFAMTQLEAMMSGIGT